MTMKKVIDWILNVWVGMKKEVDKEYRIRSDCYITWDQLMADLKRWFPDADYTYVTDKRPCLIYRTDMEKVASLNVGIFKDWTKESFDCENKANVMQGIMSWKYGGHAFGTVRVNTQNGGHMLNCFIDQYNKFNFFEPQTNKIFRPSEDLKYIVKHVII